MWNVSVIVTTYNRPDSLRLCVASLETQSVRPREVIVADDGSDPEYVPALEQIVRDSSLKMIYTRVEHNGFRVSASRNNAVRHSTGDYLFLTDGDAVMFPDVLEHHMAASGPRYWTTGRCVRLSECETERVSEELIRSGRLEEAWPGWEDPRCAALRRDAANFRWKSLIARLWPSEHRKRKVRMITIQASVPRDAFDRLNGFDEDGVRRTLTSAYVSRSRGFAVGQ